MKEYENCVPFYDISVAAGGFSESQQASNFEWVELPESYKPTKEHFVCKVTGASMNKIIPNGSWCLFKKDPGVQEKEKLSWCNIIIFKIRNMHQGIQLKLMRVKVVKEEEWSHKKIILKPNSYDPDYQPIELNDDELSTLKVVGIFVAVL